MKLKESGIGVPELLRYYTFMSEYLWTHIESNSDGQIVTVLDACGVGVTDLMGDSLLFLKEASKVAQLHYIEVSFPHPQKFLARY